MIDRSESIFSLLIQTGGVKKTFIEDEVEKIIIGIMEFLSQYQSSSEE